jgi:hypothetical protein
VALELYFDIIPMTVDISIKDHHLHQVYTKTFLSLLKVIEQRSLPNTNLKLCIGFIKLIKGTLNPPAFAVCFL